LRLQIQEVDPEESAARKLIETFARNFLAGDGLLFSARTFALREVLWQKGPVFFRLPPIALEYPYFIELTPLYATELVEHCSRKPNPGLDSLLNWLPTQGSKPVVKQTLSRLIIAVEAIPESDSRSLWQSRVQSSALALIGRPEQAANWQAWRQASDQDRMRLELAKTILERWIVRNFFRYFFEELAREDMRSPRRLFWEKYVDYIEDFKIYANHDARRRMRNNEHIRPFFDTKVGELAARDNNVFIMRIKNYDLIEFSSSGAFYAYQQGNTAHPGPHLNRSGYSERELKDSHWIAMNRLYLNHEGGRIAHTGGWENTLAQWIRTTLQISVV
jgi:hypothetical protein